MEALLYKDDYRISSLSTKITYSELRILTFFQPNFGHFSNSGSVPLR